jgi:cytochrome c-type biogenesis protein CcmF
MEPNSIAPNIGFTSIIVALLISLFYPIFVGFKFQKKSSSEVLWIGKQSALINFILLVIAFLSLVYSFVISDFSVSNVYLNSHQLKPFIYKISAVWGNHEGSMLLLLLIISGYSLIFAYLGKIDSQRKIITLACQSFISFGIIAFVVFTSNPFLRIIPAPLSGLGLNPILQDIGLAMHPPMLYTGYIGFSLIFSIAIASLLTEKIDQEFTRAIKPWLMFSWSFLTLGIGLGSWWAYRELGWGGYWFWDAVENVSLMPWLCATALFHSVMILERSDTLKIWTSFLAILSFVLCLLGIFLVRSGIITSVHAFANDPKRGIFIVFLLLVIGGGGFLIFFIKSLRIKNNESDFALFSKAGLVLINNFILCLILFIVVLGTIYPLFAELFFSASISVGPSYYKKLISPLAIILLVLMIFVPYLKPSNSGFAKKNLKINFSPMFFGHLGIFIVILGISLVALFSSSKEVNLKVDQKIEFAGYEVKFSNIEYDQGKNYLIRRGIFEIKNSNKNFILKPESRYYPVSDQNTTEASIKHLIDGDFYLVMGSKDELGNFAVRIYYKAFISLIWLGCLILFVAGIISILKRIKFKNLINLL